MTPFQGQLDVRHPWQLKGDRCDRVFRGGCSAIPLIHLKNPRILRKSAATRVARQGVSTHVCNYVAAFILNFFSEKSQRTRPYLKYYDVVIYYRRSKSLSVEISCEFSPGNKVFQRPCRSVLLIHYDHSIFDMTGS